MHAYRCTQENKLKTRYLYLAVKQQLPAWLGEADCTTQPPGNISVSLLVIGHGKQVCHQAYEEAEEEPQAMAAKLCSALPSHTPHLNNWAATALWKCRFCPCRFAWQLLISEPLTRWKSSTRKGEQKEGPWKTAGTRTTQASQKAKYLLHKTPYNPKL